MAESPNVKFIKALATNGQAVVGIGEDGKRYYPPQPGDTLLTVYAVEYLPDFDPKAPVAKRVADALNWQKTQFGNSDCTWGNHNEIMKTQYMR